MVSGLLALNTKELNKGSAEPGTNTDGYNPAQLIHKTVL